MDSMNLFTRKRCHTRCSPCDFVNSREFSGQWPSSRQRERDDIITFSPILPAADCDHHILPPPKLICHWSRASTRRQLPAPELAPRRDIERPQEMIERGADEGDARRRRDRAAQIRQTPILVKHRQLGTKRRWITERDRPCLAAHLQVDPDQRSEWRRRA